jgi:hypothetical protein
VWVFSPDLFFIFASIAVLHTDCAGAIVAVTVWRLDIQLPMQSVPITSDVVSSNLDQGDVYNIM